jgi:hypothetical protein
VLLCLGKYQNLRVALLHFSSSLPSRKAGPAAKAMAAASASRPPAGRQPTHFAPYCPHGDKCSKKGRLGWFNSMEEAKQKVINHLLASEYHADEMDDEKAEELWKQTEVDVWPEDKAAKRQKQQHPTTTTTRAKALPAASAAAPPPPVVPDLGTLISGAVHQALTSAPVLPLEPMQQQNQLAALDVSSTQNQLAFVTSAITRACEHIAKSIAANRTAARMARQAAEAFELEAHTLQNALDTIQQVYAPGR